jgi:hypothetical protein
MNDLLYSIGDLFEQSFEVLATLGNIPNVAFIILCAGALAFCMKVVTTEENICE